MLTLARNLRFRRLMLGAALAAIGITANNSARSDEPKWPTQPYKYIVVDQDVRDVLVEFGRNIGIPTRISDAVAGRRVRGEFTTLKAKEFLQRLCSSYGLVWYFDGSALHINTEAEVRTELITLVGVRSRSLVSRLEELRLTDARYPVRVTDDVRVVSVSGPPPYLALVHQAVAALEKAGAPQPVREVPDGDEKRVRVFRGNREGT
jgi:type II secretory pathway component GspD/PulD (secretin)